EEFDIKNEEWTLRKCKHLLRFVQENKDETQLKKEPGDGDHWFLPTYLGNDSENYKWNLENLDNIFVAICRFLQSYYPDISRLNLDTRHNEKISEWSVEFEKYIQNKQKKKEAKLQDKFIKEINDKWLPGFRYLYNFEYDNGDHKGDLIFANNDGFFVTVETKRVGISKKHVVNNTTKVKAQSNKYRKLLMDKTKNDSDVITVLGVCFIDKPSDGKKWFPLEIDNQIWSAISNIHKLNNQSPDSETKSIVQTIGKDTFMELSQEADSDNDITDVLENTHL
ncbi:8740_t:CDS:2, partial [Funneliformis geosporum]